MGEDLIKSASENAVGSLDRDQPVVEEKESRASISGAMKSEYSAPDENTQNIISTKIDSIDDLFGKSEKQALDDAKEKAGVKKTVVQKQQTLNQNTAKSLAKAAIEETPAPAAPVDKETMKLQ